MQLNDYTTAVITHDFMIKRRPGLKIENVTRR
jgi:hypothetical protein